MISQQAGSSVCVLWLYVWATHADSEGLDGAVQQLNQAEQVRFGHLCYYCTVNLPPSQDKRPVLGLLG